MAGQAREVSKWQIARRGGEASRSYRTHRTYSSRLAAAALHNFIALEEDAVALAGHSGIPYLAIIDFTSRPDIAAWISHIRVLRTRNRRDAALNELEHCLRTSRDPIERRRAATTILRATDPRPPRAGQLSDRALRHHSNASRTGQSAGAPHHAGPDEIEGIAPVSPAPAASGAWAPLEPRDSDASIQSNPGQPDRDEFNDSSAEHLDDDVDADVLDDDDLDDDDLDDDDLDDEADLEDHLSDPVAPALHLLPPIASHADSSSEDPPGSHANPLAAPHDTQPQCIREEPPPPSAAALEDRSASATPRDAPS